MRSLFLFIVITSFSSAAPAFAITDSALVTITFNNTIGNDKLELGKSYNDPFGEPFTLRRLKYYISNLSFEQTDGTILKVPETYYLVNEEEASLKTFSVKIKAGSYNRISFFIGVDSIKNVSGTQTDALDPMNGMFWTWNSGYIMAKLEAVSPLSKSPDQLVEYHIGGFRNNQNTVRRIDLPFFSNEIFEAHTNKEYKIDIEADINKWFKGKHELKIAEHTACTTPGDLAVLYADNYASMFRVVSTSH